MNVPAKFAVHKFTHSRDNSDWPLGWGCKFLGKRRLYGVVDGTVQKSVSEFL